MPHEPNNVAVRTKPRPSARTQFIRDLGEIADIANLQAVGTFSTESDARQALELIERLSLLIANTVPHDSREGKKG